MNTSSTATPSRVPWLGIICCLFAAVFYTGANVCLRQLAAIEADPAWVVCLKESVSVLVMGPWLLWCVVRGRQLSVHARALSLLLLTAVAAQLVGNLGFQWALGVVGLVISVPMLFSTLLLGSAVVGFIAFRESLSTQSSLAVAAVTISIVLLSLGAAGQGGQSVGAPSLLLTALAVTAAGVAGIMFAAMGAALRYAANRRVPVPVSIVVVTGTGSITLGALSLFRYGPTELLATDPVVLTWILAAGLCNVMAFSLITKGIQLTTLVHANVLNASQVALGAVAGVFLFHESHNAWLGFGITLTIFGIVTFGKPRKCRNVALNV